jgi:hypothetical protein
MAEDYGLTFAPIFVENLSTVFGRDVVQGSLSEARGPELNVAKGYSAASARSLNGRLSFCQTSNKASARESISASSW